MAKSNLKRYGAQQNFNAMLVAKVMPDNWIQKTVVLHFVEENGISTAFYATNEAYDEFAALDKWRIYDMVVNGHCVRRSACQKTLGIANNNDVRVKYPCQCTIAKKGWTLKLPYNFVKWADMNQLEEGDFVDIAGMILREPESIPNDRLRQIRIVLANEDQMQEITLTGEAASLSIKRGDTVACKGLRVKTWRQARSLGTSLLSVIEVNPTEIAEGMNAANVNIDEPKRKAMKLSMHGSTTVAQVKIDGQLAVNNAQHNMPTTVYEYILVGRLDILEESFFNGDPPFVGDENLPRMCLHSHVSDLTGVLEVKVWDHACSELFQMTGTKLRMLWETGVEQEQEQMEILQQLNILIRREHRFFCSAKVWEYGQKERKYAFQVNVDRLEVNEASHEDTTMK